MPFNLASCPAGWSEYLPARGRFIRGIDSTGTNDPDGVRALGSTQADELKSHTHSYTDRYADYIGQNGTGDTHARGAKSDSFSSGATGGAETRPKNVALLYCEKD